MLSSSGILSRFSRIGVDVAGEQRSGTALNLRVGDNDSSLDADGEEGSLSLYLSGSSASDVGSLGGRLNGLADGALGPDLPPNPLELP